MWLQVHQAHPSSVLTSPPKLPCPNAVVAQDVSRSSTHACLLWRPPPPLEQSLIKGSTTDTAQPLEPPGSTQSHAPPEDNSQQHEKRLSVVPPADAHTPEATKTGRSSRSTEDDIAANPSPRSEAQVKRLSAQLAKQQMAAQRLQLECAAHLERLTQRHHVQVSVFPACRSEES